MNHTENDFIEYYILKVRVVRSTQSKRHGEKREYFTEMLIANYPLLESLKPPNPMNFSSVDIRKLRRDS